ncbi:MAG: protein kinase [Pyrinomonadaceae bacterium]
MNPEFWGKIKQTFELALAQPEQNRIEFLRATCQGDNELFEEVISLLNAHDKTEHLIEKHCFDIAGNILPSSHRYEGRQFGHYKIIREIGRGGMGAVFLAERSDGEFQQKVALKIIRQGFTNGELEKYFRRERQILASLNHPNIAKLLDGGVSETGELFLAMEFIEGETLLAFAESLSLGEKLGLFLKICGAVAYAHRNLVVHRDLKPSNILVTRGNEPKLLDFGLAKLLDENLLDDVTQTQTAFRALTPAYASPEQLRGASVTTASDIYSLGVVLYEMLSGERPFDLEKKSLDEVLRTITQTEPLRLSQIRDPKLQTQHLRGDIENIVAMALRKEPERRFESVEAFADDIERHLSHRTVSARPNTVKYRASKFLRRNKIAAAAAALVIVALVSGLAIALWQAKKAGRQRDRAEKRFNDVRQLSNSLLFEIAPKIERLNGSTEAREILVKRALEYLDSLAAESQSDLALQSELASAYEKIGELQGNPNKPNLSDFAGAILSYEKANAIRRRLPVTPENRRLLAENFRQLSAVRFIQNDNGASLQDSSAALKIYEGLLAESPGATEMQASFIEAELEQAQIYSANNQYRTAIPLFQKAVATLPNLDPGKQKTRALTARTYSLLGNALSWDNRQPEAEVEMSKAVLIAESLAREYPNDSNIQQDVWRVFIWASSIYEDSKDEICLQFAQRAVKTSETAIASDPANMQAKHNLAKSLSRVGICSVNLKKLSEAHSNLAQAETIFLELINKEPKNRIYQNDLGKLYTRFGDTKQKQHDLNGALSAFQRSVGLFEAIAQTDERNTLARRDLAQSLKSVGLIQLELGEKENALQSLQRALEIVTQLKQQNALGDWDKSLLTEIQTALQKLNVAG